MLEENLLPWCCVERAICLNDCICTRACRVRFNNVSAVTCKILRLNLPTLLEHFPPPIQIHTYTVKM